MWDTENMKGMKTSRKLFNGRHWNKKYTIALVIFRYSQVIFLGQEDGRKGISPLYGKCRINFSLY